MTTGQTPEGMAATHLCAFGEKAWPAKDFEAYQSNERVDIFGDDLSFVVIQRAAGQAEVLTFATHPDHQGQGLASKVLDYALFMLKFHDVKEVFLEVAADNAPARSLYARAGFVAFYERKSYYDAAIAGEPKVAAICMKVDLSREGAAK